VVESWNPVVGLWGHPLGKCWPPEPTSNKFTDTWLSRFPIAFFLQLFHNKTFRISGTGPNVLQTNSIEHWQKLISTDPWPHSLFIDHWRPDGGTGPYIGWCSPCTQYSTSKFVTPTQQLRSLYVHAKRKLNRTLQVRRWQGFCSSDIQAKIINELQKLCCRGESKGGWIYRDVSSPWKHVFLS